ncbi:hypothetical protein O4H52_09925 [Sphingomonadaceae bacterium G21617-S1]|jgi:hypothetical protein|uniref:hypothetical protein n=1 Tax=Rhizorhabdus sp. TaxID=1968843 RepID=UPI0019A79B33|nr:hypothetical protein [Rhizorhabdus sp.]MBD3759359.1 hypothetical protein [Rhizorhabdus sp.]MCZ4341923.1 hypothetical protein [Sphingomonadaceae bacterium G21617-S1]
MLRGTYCILIATMMVASPAKADWQYTRWGMTPSEVETAAQAAGQTLIPSNQPMATRLLGHTGTYAVSGGVMEANFYYSDNKLEEVELKGSRDGQCYVIGLGLNEKYGTPFSKTDMVVATKFIWHDQDQGNSVEFMRFSSSCYLSYRSLATRDKSGL